MRRIFELRESGLLLKQIAGEVGLSEKSVAKYSGQINRLLGLPNRTGCHKRPASQPTGKHKTSEQRDFESQRAARAMAAAGVRPRVVQCPPMPADDLPKLDINDCPNRTRYINGILRQRRAARTQADSSAGVLAMAAAG